MIPKKILIVDDDPSIVMALENLLNLEGYEVMKELNGKSGLKTAMSFLPDLILLDVMMPFVDGLVFASEIRKNKDLCDTKIIFITAKGEGSDRMKGYLKGGDDYLVKPFSTEQLLSRIKYFLD